MKKIINMIKNFTLLILLFAGLSVYSQQKIRFEYDEAGNQKKREYCINCASKNDNTPIKEFTDLKDSDLLKFSAEDKISYYPNPVKEELFLKWELIENKNVTSIDIFAISGSLVESFKNLTSLNTKTLAFYSFPEGIYTIVLYYSNGEQKTIKIVKK